MPKKPDFAGDLRERVARAIYAKRPDCLNKPWPVETAEQKRAYPHSPIAAVDLSYEYADAAPIPRPRLISIGRLMLLIQRRLTNLGIKRLRLSGSCGALTAHTGGLKLVARLV